MIETYWNEMFGQFKTTERAFSIPGFPEPLMSAKFGLTNIVGEAEHPKLSFKLCTFSPVKSSIHQAKIEPLSKTLTNKEFWAYQKSHHTEAMPFIQRVLPFLNTLSKDHWHVFIEGENGIRGSAIVGRGESVSFFFNASVRKDERQNGVCRDLLMACRVVAENRPGFYWTVHPWLTLDADKVENYHIING